jgi:hypothetical protein
MFPWFLKQKERNMVLTEAITTELPIPIATEAKRMSIDNFDARIKRAEKAIFDEACDYINDAIKHGYMTTNFDAFFSVNRVLTLDKSSVVAAINDCIEHLSTFGYTAKRDGEKHLSISWQYPKEISLNDIEWSV